MISLALCPVILAIAVILLPQIGGIYGTIHEKIFLFLMLSLPLLGVFGLVRYSGLTTKKIIMWSVVYLGLMALPVAGAVIFVGCSWAGACF